ncbi:MAG: FtsQ-type POTRA domain-containing protein [Desulfobacterales bacterium]
MRTNHYKSSVTKRHRMFQNRLFLCLKIGAGSVGLVLISFVLVFGHDFLTQWNFFGAQQVTVRGIHRISKKDVLNQAQINKGINVLSVNLSMLRKRLLAHTWIAEAHVRRELPNMISIRIEEHEPLAIIDLGRKLLINHKGEIFKEKSSSDPLHLPIISGLEYTDLNVSGKPPSKSFKAVMDILRLGQTAKSILPNKQIKWVHVDPDMGITLFTFNRIKEIKLGFGNYPQKYKSLKQVIDYLKRHQRFSGFVSMDLNDTNRIVAQPIKIKAAAPA